MGIKLEAVKNTRRACPPCVKREGTGRGKSRWERDEVRSEMA